MRKARVTWEGAFHHIMNRGLNKQKIFFNAKLKEKYISLLSDKCKKYGIKIFSYCIMDNHFHIALENSSGHLADFMKSVNGQYGQYYRNNTNSKGYVFEDRFKSTLIQDDRYLITVIMYILLNPVRSGYVENPFDYKWSSAGEYFRSGGEQFVDKELIETIFNSHGNFINGLIENKINTPNEEIVGYDRVLGDTSFMLNIKKTWLRSFGMIKEKSEFKEMLINEIISSIEKKYNIKITDIDISSMPGRKLRDELLIMLRDSKQLSYKDIRQIDIFKAIKIETLKTIYYRKKVFYH